MGAPEFIPPLTMTCPLVEIRTPAGAEHELSGETYWVAPSPRRRHHSAKKARPPAVVIPARSCEGVEPTSTSVKQLPEASEEDCQHRAEMRRKSVACGKATNAYQWYNSVRPRETDAKCEP